MSGASQLPVYSPTTVSQILSRIYNVIRANYRTQLGLATLPAIAFFVGYGSLFTIMGSAFLPAILTGKQPPAPQAFMVIFVAFLCFMVLYLIALGPFQAAASYAGVKADCGIQVTVNEAYGVARGRPAHFIGLMLSLYGICFGPLLVIEAGTFGVMATFAANKMFAPVLMVVFPIAMLLLLVAMILGLIGALRLSLSFPAAVFEGLGIPESIKRSWALTRGAAGRIFVVLLVVYAAMYFAMMVVMMLGMVLAVIGYLVFSSHLAHPTTHMIVILVACGAAVYVALISVFAACFWTGFATSLSVIYNDQRMRMAPPQSVGPAGAPA